ncbi:gamma-glutamyltransferase [Aliidiomarina quisquiliarum]|uniref:gamma-glutamyltransferase n=1 Tax=Aliidiomarina quisquiliarum TaxID=2938947 RepID=UPI00208F6362|nr:gamma-glutamyltransferase [Aliidiomarina quisquiliarum]MCO4321380.1 gamma-glutamyltransferase [Aliidiomarina quisquiliarum]
MIYRHIVGLLLAVSLVGCGVAEVPSKTVHAGAVASPDKYGAAVAEQVLRNGGNAVDAAVATAFTLAVTYPEAGNIGGGGFMTIWFDGKAYFLDYRETAPAAAHRDMYLDENKQVIDNLSLIGAQASGVPGTVMGLWEAHQKFGSLPWGELVNPAIHYAENGFKVSAKQSIYRENLFEKLAASTNFMDYFGTMEANTTLVQTELATTLGRIATHGPSDFYQGETAALLVAQMERDGGLITLEDLGSYTAVWREPVITDWQGYQLVTAPPPSSGGIALAQLLGLKQRLASHFEGTALNSTQYVHLMAEIEKRVFADRADYLGDPSFVTVPQAKLLEPAYLDQRASEVNTQNISVTADVKPGLEGYHTTHFSILDKDGNAVSNTYTLNLSYGSGVVVEGAGFLMNNEMDDFSSKAGVPNAFGVVGNDANSIEPGKRMLSSMAPSLLLKNNQVELVIGTPGGSTIFTSIFQVINNLYDYDMSLADAVAAPRFHHQLLPKDQINMEPYAPLAAETQQALTNKGYNLVTQGWNLGDIQAIKVTNGHVEAVADPRSRGVAKVFPY